jgi:two-component system cell cycle response regulator
MPEFDKTLSDDRTVPAPTNMPKRPCLTFLSGGTAGLVYTLLPGTETMIGRGTEADIPVGEPRVSRKHALFRVSEEGAVFVEDQGSSNGTFVNKERVQSRELKDGDRVQIGFGCIIKFSYQDELEYQLQHEIAQGTKDPLSGLYTRKYLQQRTESEFLYAHRHNGELGVLLFVVDKLHEIILWHGQPAGDFVVSRVAQLVNDTLRAGDVLARYDLERFAVLARDLDDQSAEILARRIRKIIEDNHFDFDGTRIHSTVSIGIATLAGGPEEPEQLMRIAEAALQEVREKGGPGAVGANNALSANRSEVAAPTVILGTNAKS